MKLVLVLAVAGFGGLAAAAVAAPAQAAACTAAGSPATRHAICGNPAARKADAAMTAALDALIKISTSGDQQVFEDSQKYWTDDRDTDCDSVDDSGRAAKPAAIAKCAAGESDDRYRFLSGLPDEGPGAGAKIVPVMREGQGFIWSFHFADPQTAGEKLLNQQLDGKVATLHIGKIGDDTDYTDNFDAELRYASPDFLSAAVTGEYVSPGGADNRPFDFNLNIDMRAGTLFGFADAFGPDVLPKLQQQCETELKEYLTPTSGESAADAATYKAQVDTFVGDLSKWSFSATQASINMNPGDEDPYVCHFGYAGLRKLIKPGFPLPAANPS